MSGSNEPVSRREFLRTAVTAAGACYAAAVGYPVFRYLTSPAEQAMSLAAVTEVTLQDAHTLAAGSVHAVRHGRTGLEALERKSGSGRGNASGGGPAAHTADAEPGVSAP